ncbi:type II/IV secretion system protein [Patescibacteria group bacterium]|nr:type II/IV secretion system protein [Patescibacteria group bacterium]
MPSHFDTTAEDEKLAAVRAREEEDLARVLAEKNNVPYTDLSIVAINMDALRVISQKDAEEAQAVAFDKNGKHLSLAVRSLSNDTLTRILHELETQGYQVEKYLMSSASLTIALDRYRDLSLATESKAGVFDIAGDELLALTAKLTSLGALRTFLNEALTSKNHAQTSLMFEGILASAFALEASDIHIEPEEEQVRIRFRLDGFLTDVFSLNPHTYKLINSRIKILSGLKLNIANRAQDGRFSVRMNNKEIEIRTSMIPGNYGEAIVMRLLDPSNIQAALDSMGIHPKLLARLRQEIKRPNGMLLTTGPTGSGKTTTLYAFLQEIYTPDIEIITIEDPIEYHLSGIVQTQTNIKDYTFALGLRSILRQDPDVIMVGEIRDAEVAETAVQAALTGHFVFTTLHTNNAAGAFPRLADLGVDPKTFPSAVSVAMAQRLVRTLNSETRAMRPTTDEEKKTIEKIFSTLTDPSLMPVSIDQVGAPTPKDEDDTGYKGRTGLYEAVFMDEHLGEFLRDNPNESSIVKEVAHQGYLTLAQAGVLKALEGITSLEEVFSVVDLPRE